MNKFERWLYVLFDKTNGLKDLIILYKEKREKINKKEISKNSNTIFLIINMVGCFYLFYELIFNFSSIILNLLNLYFIENYSETNEIIFKIGLYLLALLLVLRIPNIKDVFKVKKISTEITTTVVLVVMIIGYIILFSILNKNNKTSHSKRSDFIVNSEIPVSKETKGKIFVDKKEIPIKIIDKNRIETEEKNEKYIVNIGNEEVKVMDCFKNNCENIKKGQIINLKDKKFILFDKKKYEEYEKKCKNNHNLKKCYENQKYEWIIRGNILKGEILKIEDNYYIFNESTISTFKNSDYIIYHVGKLSLSVIILTIFYVLSKVNKDYYSNRRKEKEEKKEFIKLLIGENKKKYKKDKFEEEIKELEAIFNFSMFKIFFTIPPLATITFGILNFIQEPKINFKINLYSIFSIMLLLVFISTIILLMVIEFIVRNIIEIMYLPRNEFFEFTEIILEIAEEETKDINEIEIFKKFLKYEKPLNKVSLKKLEDVFIYNSNAIEGNTLTFWETRKILRDGIAMAKKSLKEYKEVKNQRHALNFLKKYIKMNKPLSLELVKVLYTLVLNNDTENKREFKQNNNKILESDLETISDEGRLIELVDRESRNLIKDSFSRTNLLNEGRLTKLIGEKTHTGFKKSFSAILDEKRLIKLIDKFNREGTENLIIKVSHFYADFEKIHQSIDGNGKIGRLLLNLELMKNGYPITVIRNKDRDEYYTALEAAQIKEDYSLFTDFIKKSIENTFWICYEYFDKNTKIKFEEYLKKNEIDPKEIYQKRFKMYPETEKNFPNNWYK